MKYFIAISILLSKFSDSIISNTEFFKLSTPQCLSAISVFDTKPSNSKLQCASSCLDNLVGMCGMFIWNSEKTNNAEINRCKFQYLVALPLEEKHA
jgi:hypothetical protein